MSEPNKETKPRLPYMDYIRDDDLYGQALHILNELKAAIILSGGSVSLSNLARMPLGKILTMCFQNGIQIRVKPTQFRYDLKEDVSL